MVVDEIISCKNLSFYFGTQQVLKNISLSVPRGSVYGFLGPNGAGKTTTIKLLLNLLQNQEKNIFLFGKELQHHREEILSNIGSLIESPALYHHLNGFENLKARAIILGVKDARIHEVLNIVGLADAAKKKAGKYSLGMKQRLGIALALLNNPQLLILDEPTNGLDPNGIIEVRNLIKKLASEHQKTIFISSHLLSEVEKMATHVGILYQGNLAFDGKIEDLQQLKSVDVCIETNNNATAADFIGLSEKVVIQGNQLRVAYKSPQQIAKINKQLVNNGFEVYSIHQEKKDLESLFLDLTQNTLS